MSETAIATTAAEALPDIDSFLKPTHDEYSRQRSVAVLHSHAVLNLRFDVRKTYERNVKPQFEAENGRAPKDGYEIAKAIKGDHFFKFYSAIRYNAQEMGPMTRQASVERALPQMIEVARQAARTTRPAARCAWIPTSKSHATSPRSTLTCPPATTIRNSPRTMSLRACCWAAACRAARASRGSTRPATSRALAIPSPIG